MKKIVFIAFVFFIFCAVVSFYQKGKTVKVYVAFRDVPPSSETLQNFADYVRFYGYELDFEFIKGENFVSKTSTFIGDNYKLMKFADKDNERKILLCYCEREEINDKLRFAGLTLNEIHGSRVAAMFIVRPLPDGEYQGEAEIHEFLHLLKFWQKQDGEKQVLNPDDKMRTNDFEKYSGEIGNMRFYNFILEKWKNENTK